MSNSINRRYALIAIIALSQAICLCVSMAFFSAWLHRSMRDAMTDQVLADNILIAGEMSKLIEQMGVNDLRKNEASWNKLQEAIRDLALPNQGFVCLVDAETEQLLCHPALGTHPLVEEGMQGGIAMVKPDMVKPDMVKPGMVKPGMVKPSLAAPWHKIRKPQGRLENCSGEMQVIAAAYLPEMNAHVKVHQKVSGVEKSVARVLSPLRPISIVVGIGLVAFTTLLISSLMTRYENRLEGINKGLENLIDQRTDSLRKTRDAVVFGLAKLAESRDTDTGEHLDRIRLYVSLLAASIDEASIGRDRGFIETLSLASSLHDIGKVGIPDSVLLKPSRLTPEELSVMQKHAVLGGDCLKAIGEQLGDEDFLQLAREIAYGHHEKWDGSGYPFGIAGSDIPISARIVALADVYDALRSRRPYKDPMSHEKARAIILGGSGSHFDPQVVDAFVKCEDLFIEVSEKYNTSRPAKPMPAVIELPKTTNLDPVLA